MQSPPFPLPPPRPGETPAERAAAQARALLGTLRTASALVAARREIELAGLDNSVGRLCAASLDLPREEGLAMRPLLAELLAELDGLAAAMTATEPPESAP